jgi:hypothetical protein
VIWRTKYQKHLLLLPLLLLATILYAQRTETNTDSIPVLSRDMDNYTDTGREAINDQPVVEDYQAEPKAVTPSYFVSKQMQSNGGGPDSLHIRRIPDSTLKRMQQKDEFWYVNYLFEKQQQQKEEETAKPYSERPIFQVIMWTLIIGGFLAFLILYLSNSNIGVFRRSDKSIENAGIDELETENIFAIDYQRQIEKAAAAGNHRLAIRLLYLRLLKSLADKKVIDYQHDRTNFDYLLQLHSTRYYPDFFRLTRNYEYIWYGLFPIERSNFELIWKDFENFEFNIRRH